MRHVTTTIVLTLVLRSGASAQAPPPEVAHLDGFLAAMGGRDAWTRLTGMRVMTTRHDADVPAPYQHVLVSDFGRPATRAEARGPGYVRLTAFAGDSGWRSDGLALSALDQEGLHDEKRDWESGAYRTIVRLARGDASLRVEWTAPDCLTVFGNDGVRVNWFRLNQRHEPIAFGTWDSEVGTTLGPLAAGPGGIRYPRWGASPDGRSRYEVDRITTFAGVVSIDLTRPVATPLQGR